MYVVRCDIVDMSTGSREITSFGPFAYKDPAEATVVRLSEREGVMGAVIEQVSCYARVPAAEKVPEKE